MNDKIAGLVYGQGFEEIRQEFLRSIYRKVNDNIVDQINGQTVSSDRQIRYQLMDDLE